MSLDKYTPASNNQFRVFCAFFFLECLRRANYFPAGTGNQESNGTGNPESNGTGNPEYNGTGNPKSNGTGSSKRKPLSDDELFIGDSLKPVI